MEIPNVIETEQQLDSVICALTDQHWIAVDCEFMREDTYYPKLCLIQLATAKFNACIDVLRLNDLTPIKIALMDCTSTKIFHSSSQDLETLNLTFDNSPSPIFDTQIAASMLGYGDQISYANLVEEICKIRLSKSQTRTDWSKRPLSNAQVQYALEDVIHLGQLYKHLKQQLKERDRLEWLKQECEKTVANSNQQTNDGDWKSIRGAGALQGRVRYRFAQMANWREQTAQSLNRPKQWVLTNKQLLEFANRANLSPSMLSDWQPHSRLRSHSERFRQELLEIFHSTQNADYPAEFDQPPMHQLTGEQNKLVKSLMQLVKAKAEQLEISSSLLANRKSLEHLVQAKPSRVLKGWRKSVIGDQLFAHLQATSAEPTNTSP